MKDANNTVKAEMVFNEPEKIGDVEQADSKAKAVNPNRYVANQSHKHNRHTDHLVERKQHGRWLV